MHALGQVISFYARQELPIAELTIAMNRSAPGEIAIHRIREMDRRFHASFCATARRYRYRVAPGEHDLDMLNRMLDKLCG